MSTRALAFAVASVIIGLGLLVALVLLGRGRARGQEGPFLAGYADSLETQIDDEGPVLMADPFGQRSLYIDVEGDALVALVNHTPGDPGCAVQWKDPRGGYVDCDGKVLHSVDLERYATSISENRDTEGGLYVDVRRVTPAPGESPD